MRKFNSVFITGGAGYCGSKLVPQLLAAGYKVTVYDSLYFSADYLPAENEKFTIIKGDIRDKKLFSKSVFGHDVVVNLACISNDPSFELNEDLSTKVNLDAFEPMVIESKKAGIKRFIYASTSSVYGLSKMSNVTEDHPLVPITLYNKYKAMCEPLLLKHTSKDFIGIIFRPATVCGFAPRMRLDLSVNLLTNLAINKGIITVFGGSQMRPNLHIQDYCDAVQLFIESEDDLIANQIFNIGKQNLTINEIALIVKNIVLTKFPDKLDIKIEKSYSDDVRSYHINSDKIKHHLNFEPKYTIEDAINDLCKAFQDNLIVNQDDDIYYNVKRLKRLNIK